MLEELIEDNAICAVAGKLLLEQCQDSLNKVFSFDSKDVAEPFFAGSCMLCDSMAEHEFARHMLGKGV